MLIRIKRLKLFGKLLSLLKDGNSSRLGFS